MGKRITARGIIIENDYVYLMHRKRINSDGTIREYYVIPGGGVEENETLEETVIRELQEEFSIDTEVLKYLGKEENDNSIFNLFACKIISGIPKLGGPELKRNCDENHYEIAKVAITDVEQINSDFKDYILKLYNNEI